MEERKEIEEGNGQGGRRDKWGWGRGKGEWGCNLGGIRC